MEMPIDKNERVPQVGGIGQTDHVAISTTTALSDEFDYEPVAAEDKNIVTVYADTDCFIKLGDSGVEATTSDAFIPSGCLLDIAMDTTNGERYIAAITASGTGTLHITQRL